jgi:hypothetical protein
MSRPWRSAPRPEGDDGCQGGATLFAPLPSLDGPSGDGFVVGHRRLVDRVGNILLVVQAPAVFHLDFKGFRSPLATGRRYTHPCSTVDRRQASRYWCIHHKTAEVGLRFVPINVKPEMIGVVVIRVKRLHDIPILEGA